MCDLTARRRNGGGVRRGGRRWHSRGTASVMSERRAIGGTGEVELEENTAEEEERRVMLASIA
jgi:hypothetical protein